MKTKLVFLIALLALVAMASIATAAEGNVTITVTDTETGTLQANVEVALVGISTSYSVTIYTDSNGESFFADVPYGTYELYLNSKLVDPEVPVNTLGKAIYKKENIIN